MIDFRHVTLNKLQAEKPLIGKRASLKGLRKKSSSDNDALVKFYGATFKRDILDK